MNKKVYLIIPFQHLSLGRGELLSLYMWEIGNSQRNIVMCVCGSTTKKVSENKTFPSFHPIKCPFRLF